MRDFLGDASYPVTGLSWLDREWSTSSLDPGTEGGGLVTRVGSHCLLMVGAHIAHDCQLGSNIIMANNASLAGHVKVGDWAILSGYSLIHQFCTVGAHSFTSFASHVNQSIPPYVTVSGEKAKAKGKKGPPVRPLIEVYHLLPARWELTAEWVGDKHQGLSVKYDVYPSRTRFHFD